jgi:hypothetical protein
VSQKKAKTKSKRAAPRKAESPFPDVEHLGPPPEGDPKRQATYFMGLLEAFAQHGTPEATRLRSALIEAVDTYSEQATKSIEAARVIFASKIAGIETGVMAIALRSVKKMRERVLRDGRDIGTKSMLGKNMQAFSEGLGIMADAMEILIEAAAAGDRALRERATAAMNRASELLSGLTK